MPCAMIWGMKSERRDMSQGHLGKMTDHSAEVKLVI